jgi:hypothetical protein
MKPFCLATAVLMLLFGAISGCANSYQTFNYRNQAQSDAHLIPGLEPEESTNKIMITVQGKGFEPANGSPAQRQMLAERAAVIDGYRKLAERLTGVMIRGYTKDARSSLSSDEISAETSAYLRGAQVSNVVYQQGMAQVDVTVYIEPRKNRFHPRIRLNPFSWD